MRKRIPENIKKARRKSWAKKYRQEHKDEIREYNKLYKARIAKKIQRLKKKVAVMEKNGIGNMEKLDGVVFDKNLALLVKAFFLELMKKIENPERGEIRNKLEWYEDVLVWAKKGSFWFDAYEYCFRYDQGKLRNAIKLKVKLKLKDYEGRDKRENKRDIRKRLSKPNL